MNYLLKHPGFLKFLIIVILILTVSVVFARNTLFPVIFSIAETEAIREANQIISEVIEEEVEGIKYEDLVNYKTNENGDIVMMQPDVREVNRISSRISQNINNHWDEIDNLKVGVPLLRLIGFDMLAGIGPNINIEVMPLGFNQAPILNDSFEEAGINQTRHKIYMEIDFGLKLIVPFSSKTTHIKADVPVIEVTIVGKVPEIYVGLKGDESSGIFGEINSNK
ncbi:MAG: sporulation protein YunB [Halanaerobiales bacterium]